MSRPAAPALAAVVFDWGGVLASEPRRAALRRLEARLGLGPGDLDGLFSSARFFTDEEWIEACAGRVGEDAFWSAVLGRMPRVPDEAVAREFLREVVWTPVRSAMLALLRELRPSLRLALLSNNTGGLRRVVDPLGLFDVVAVSAEVAACKPDPAAFGHVVERLGLPADAVLMVDDAPWNVSAARSVGMLAHRFTGAAALRRRLGALPAAAPPTR